MITLRPVWGTALALSLSATAFGPASAAAHRHATLNRPQVHKIVAVTGYRGLRSHHFRVEGVFKDGPVTVKVVRLDGAHLEIPLAELHRDLRRAERLTAARPTFTTTLKTGHGHKQKITYDVAPAGASAPRESYLRYVIFSAHHEQLGKLTRPQRVPGVQALTVISEADRLNVTLLHDIPRSDKWGPSRLSAARLYAMIECLNTSSRVTVSPKTLHRLAAHHVDLSYLTDPNHKHPSRRQELTNLGGRGFEIWANSLGFAVMSARAHTSYRAYSQQAAHNRFAIYRRNDLRYLAVSAKQYRRLAR